MSRLRATGMAACAILGVALLVAAVPAMVDSSLDWYPAAAYATSSDRADMYPWTVQCNEPEELFYLADLLPVCLSPDAGETLIAGGIDLVRGPAQGPSAELELTAEEEAWLRDHPVIRVAHDPGWFPIEYADENGQLAGVTLDYVIEFEGLTGADFQPILTEDWTRTLQAVQDRDADVIFMVAHTAERAEYMGFTTPHHHLETRLVSLDEGPLSLDEPGLRVLTIRNYEIESWLDENRPDVEYISVDSFTEGLAMLGAGEADAFAATWPVMRAIAEMEGMTVHNAGPTGHSYPLAVGYRSDQPVLGSIVQKALDASPPLLEIFEGSAQGPSAELELTAEEEAWLRDHPVIRVAHDPGWFPIEYADENGQLAGVTLDYVIEFEGLTGADFQPILTEDWTRTLQAVQDRDADVIFMVAHTAERAEYMGFTTPHHHLETRLVSLDEGPLSLDEPGLRVLTIRNYEIESWLDENRPDVEYISVDSFTEGLAMLGAGEADAFAATWPVMRAIAEMEGMTVHNAGPTGHSYPLAVGYRSDQPVLGSIVQKALDASPPLLEIFEGSAAPAWTAEEEEWLASNPVIRVAYEPGWFPIEYVDEAGRLSGATGAYMAEFESITGADFQEAQIADWTAALQAIRDRDADMLFMVVNTAERSEYMGFTDPHFTIESVLIAAEDVQLTLEPGLRVLTIRDYSVEGWLDENYPDIDRISVGSFSEGLAMLREGEADAFVDVWQVVRAIAELEGMTVYNAGPTGYSYDLTVGYRSDQPVLGSILQKTLDYIPQSTLERLQSTTP